MLVVTERLGRPRWGTADFVQTKLVYPVDADTPTARCHLLPAPRQPALCGFPWEVLVEVPGADDLDDIPPDLRCTDCAEAGIVQTTDRVGRARPRLTFESSD